MALFKRECNGTSVSNKRITVFANSCFVVKESVIGIYVCGCGEKKGKRWGAISLIKQNRLSHSVLELDTTDNSYSI